MTKELTVTNSQLTVNDEQLEMVRRTFFPTLTDDELKLFGHVCNHTRLDPILKQIYAIKRYNKHQKAHIMCIQTSIDGFRLIAERTRNYSPGKDTEFLYGDNKRLVGAKVYVKKLTKDGTWHDISAVAMMSEYNPNMGLWLKLPHVMIEKCAEARALRRAFPNDLSGLYSDDEMEQADGKDKAPTPRDKPKDEFISKEKVEDIQAVLEEHDDIKASILKLCKVTRLEDIKESQLGPCQGFVYAKIKEIKDGKDKS